MFQILIESSVVDVNSVTLESKTTPLHLAAALGNEKIVNLLLKAPGIGLELTLGSGIGT